jgi:uncharacterized Zn finger protein (UPF0148 family)
VCLGGYGMMISFDCPDCGVLVENAHHNTKRCKPCGKEAARTGHNRRNNKYRLTEKGKETNKKAHRKYKASEKGKAKAKAHNALPSTRETKRLYKRSDRGRASDRAYKHKRRALQRSIEDGSVSQIWWLENIIQSERCHYCFRRYEEGEIRTGEHIIPITRGGTHSTANLISVCDACNCSKNNKTPGEWL